MEDGPEQLHHAAMPQVIDYLSFTKAELITLVRHLPSDTVVGITVDLARDVITQRFVPLSPISVAELLVSLDQLDVRHVSVTEEEHCFFVIHLKESETNVSPCVIVVDKSPLFAQLRAKRKTMMESW